VDLRVNVRFRILLLVYVIGLFIVTIHHFYQDGYLFRLHTMCLELRVQMSTLQDRQQIPLVNVDSVRNKLEDLTKGL
jgi:hypothetical protein